MKTDIYLVVLDEMDSKNMLLDTVVETYEIQDYDNQEIEFLQKKFLI